MPAPGGIPLSSNFGVQTPKPLDNRFVCSDIADRDSLTSVQRHPGLLTYVESEETFYALIGGTSNSDWQEIGGGGIEVISPSGGDDTAALEAYATSQVAQGQALYFFDPTDAGFQLSNTTNSAVYNNAQWVAVSNGTNNGAVKITWSGTNFLLVGAGMSGFEFDMTSNSHLTIQGYSEHTEYHIAQVLFRTLGASTTGSFTIDAAKVSVGRVAGQSAGNRPLISVDDRSRLDVAFLDDVDLLIRQNGIVKALRMTDTDVEVGYNGTTPQNYAHLSWTQVTGSTQISVFGDYCMLIGSGASIDVQSGATNTRIVGTDNTLTDNGTDTIIDYPTRLDVRGAGVANDTYTVTEKAVRDAITDLGSGYGGGEFYRTTNLALTTTPTVLIFDTTKFVCPGVSYNSVNGQFTITEDWDYNFISIAEIERTSGSSQQRVWWWMRKNGIDVANSAKVEGSLTNNQQGQEILNELERCVAWDVIEIVVAATSNQYQLLYTPAQTVVWWDPFDAPGSPSASVTVSKVW